MAWIGHYFIPQANVGETMPRVKAQFPRILAYWNSAD